MNLMDEMERAEAFLNSPALADSELPRGRLGRGFGLAVLAGVLAFLITSGDAHAASCDSRITDPTYAATFMDSRLLVGRPRGGGSTLVAQIWTAGSCQASCQVRSLEKDAQGPVALQLSCRSAGLRSFVTDATLLWGRGRGMSKTPTLRFGTWLQGYEHMALNVQLDRYARPSRRLADRAPAVVVGRRAVAAR